MSFVRALLPVAPSTLIPKLDALEPTQGGSGVGAWVGAGGLEKTTAAEVIALPYHDEPHPLVLALTERLGLDLRHTASTLGLTAKPGQSVSIPASVPSADGRRPVRLLIVGVGSGRGQDLRQAAATQAKATTGASLVQSWLGAVLEPSEIAALVDGLVLGSFSFRLGELDAATLPAKQVEVVLAGPSNSAAPPPGEADSLEASFTRAVAVAEAAWLSRALATFPANIKNPQWLAEQAVAIADQNGLTAQVWDERELAARGMGGLVSVGQASATPPRLVHLSYVPEPSDHAASQHVVLVGKGITFDSGGLSIKPGESMATMKRDMTGAGVVLAVMSALRAVACPVRVTALLCLAENSIGAHAMRPGDVITHFGGRTSEVTNTDAEGRLVLADALAYAVAELSPDVLVDVATLTGAAKVALGQGVGCFFSTHDALAESLQQAGTETGEPIWRFPLAAQYEAKLASKVADAVNAPDGPGAIVAALYLKHFVGEVPWAHFDIASVGDAPTDSFEWTEGPTGFGVRLLTRWLTENRIDQSLGLTRCLA